MARHGEVVLNNRFFYTDAYAYGKVEKNSRCSMKVIGALLRKHCIRTSMPLYRNRAIRALEVSGGSRHITYTSPEYARH
jgi:hypothetical protein